MAATKTTNTWLEPTQAFIEQQQQKRAAGAFKPIQNPDNAAGGTISASVTPITSTVSNPTPVTEPAPVVTPQPAPVQTPVSSPVVAPTQNLEPTQEFIDKQQQKRDAGAFGMTPKEKEQWFRYITPTPVVKPVETIAPASTPAQKVEPVKAEITPKVNFNTSQGRETEISTNLANITTQDPGLLKDRTRFNNAFWYNTADEWKKAILDSFFAGKQPIIDRNAIFNQLKTGQVVDPEALKTIEGQIGKYKFDTLNKFLWMTSDQLFTEMKNGNLPTEIRNELNNSPVYQEAKAKEQAYLENKNINGNASAIYNGFTGKSTETTDPLANINQNFVSMLTAAGIDLPSYRDFLKKSDPELEKTVSTMNAQNKLLKEKIDTRDAMVKTILTDHPRLSKWAAIALAATMNESLNEEIKSMSYAIDTMAADIKYKTDIASKDWEAQQSIAKEKRWYVMDFMKENYKAQLGLKTKQAEFEQLIEQKARVANDPVLATQDIIDTYKKMGVMAGRSDNEIIQSVKNDIAGGMTLWQSLTNLNKAFQSKDTYKAAIAKATYIPWSADNNKPFVVGAGSSVYDPSTKSWITAPTSTNVTPGTAPTGQITTQTFSSSTQPTVKVSLDSSAMNWLSSAIEQLKSQWIETVIGSNYRTWEEQKKLHDAYLAGTGWIAAAPGTSKHELWLGIDIYSDSKLSAPTQAQIATMEANWWKHMAIPGDMGHFEYVGTPNTTFKPENKPLYDKYGSGKFTAADWKAVGNADQFKKEAKNYVIETARNELPTLDTYKNDLQYLKDNAQYRNPAEAVFNPSEYQKYIDYATKLAAVKARTSLQNLIDLKSNGATFWSLSNQELNFITDASETGNLTVWGDEDTYKKELDKIMNKVDKGINTIRNGNIFWNKSPVTPISDINNKTTQSTSTTWVGSTVNYGWKSYTLTQ